MCRWCRIQPFDLLYKGRSTKMILLAMECTPAMKCLCVMLLCFLADGPVHAQTLSGHWCGFGEQVGPGDHRSAWSASITLKGAQGLVEYPSLQCGGTLTFERADGDVHYYIEHITQGRDRCIDGSIVGVELVGGSLRVEWTGGGAQSTAVLHPRCASQSPHAGKPMNRVAVAIRER